MSPAALYSHVSFVSLWKDLRYNRSTCSLAVCVHAFGVVKTAVNISSCLLTVHELEVVYIRDM